MTLQLLNRRPNAWQIPGDERFDGLLEIANAINDAIDLAGGDEETIDMSELMPDLFPVWNPLRLAAAMREAADRIERATRT
jgi:hypothetical protein